MASSMSRRNYDVFLSFRGPDSRNTIASHLYNALCQKGVYVFKDNEELEAGQRRSELFEAIEVSRIAIVMFSENYAGSRWCLDELKKIIDCRDQGKLTVLPIFYRVSPGEVRLSGKKRCYQAAMEQTEAKYGKDSEMVKGWKEALWQGGDMIGIQLGQGQDEGTVVREVVEKVLKKLDRVPLEVAKHPVGIDRHVEAIMPYLHISPHENNVYMVGIVGEGGMGKTTISKAICNSIFNRFDDWCFLPNVRETSGVFNGLVLLQQTLLRQLLSNKNLMVWSVDEGKQLIKERLRNKRVLVILDDVDDLAQFDVLAGNLDWFGKGSRIIITTRNSHLLHPDRVQYVYKVSLLEKAEADSLFRLHAFGERQENMNINRDLIERFVDYASQLPLALVVLGEFLRGRSPSEWEGKLKELVDSPDTKINSVLRISFDGLEDKHKEIFLDVACFFKGWYIYEVEAILDSCGFATSLGIAILVERCLVTVDDHRIQMHDLLGVMGQNIVRADYLKGVGLPSRIWLYEDFLEVLSKNMAHEKYGVKGIVLNLAEKKDRLVKANALMDFKNLRIFIARNVDRPDEPLRLPGELRWFEWRGYSASSIEFDQLSNKIVNLDFAESRITKIKGKGFKELKYLNLEKCMSLTSLNKIPSFKEELKFLQFLNLSGTSLKELPESIGNLIALKQLIMSGCKHLSIIPHSIYKLRALEELYLDDCRKLRRFPRRLARVGSEAADLGLPNLCNLVLSNCRLKDLEFLEDLTCFQTLYYLSLSGNEYARGPRCLRKFKKLRWLQLRDCRSLIEVPELPSDSILFVDGSKCFNLTTFPSLHTCSQLFLQVDLSGCGLGRYVMAASLPLEKVRQYTEDASFVCPASELPQWVNFQTTDFGSRYQVSLPRSMSEDDILGLAIFITVDYRSWIGGRLAEIFVGGRHRLVISDNGGNRKGVLTCFKYIPRRPILGYDDPNYEDDLNWHIFTVEFPNNYEGMYISFGLRMLCKREEDDQRIRVRRIDSDERDSLESEYTLPPNECWI